jgi:hypothetical protein
MMEGSRSVLLTNGSDPGGPKTCLDPDPEHYSVGTEDVKITVRYVG